jgi:hypothetical protein
VETRALPVTPAASGASAGAVARGIRQAGVGSGMLTPTAVPAGPGDGGPDAIRQAASRAAEALFRGRDVSVESFYDEGSGRAVYRVADRVTGEILVETPPEEMLRFFASARERPGSPLVALEA